MDKDDAGRNPRRGCTNSINAFGLDLLRSLTASNPKTNIFFFALFHP